MWLRAIEKEKLQLNLKHIQNGRVRQVLDKIQVQYIGQTFLFVQTFFAMKLFRERANFTFFLCFWQGLKLGYRQFATEYGSLAARSVLNFPR